MTVLDPMDNKPWNFDDPEKRRRAKDLLRTVKPKLLIGSPMCRTFSNLMNLNKHRMDPDKWRAMVEHGVRHLKCMCELYQIQIEGGRLILHEHPASATSWKEDCIEKVSQMEGVEIVVGHMCRWGMTSEDADGKGLVKKPTKSMTNSPAIGRHLAKTCKGGHRHVQLLGGRAKAAEI